MLYKSIDLEPVVCYVSRAPSQGNTLLTHAHIIGATRTCSGRELGSETTMALLQDQTYRYLDVRLISQQSVPICRLSSPTTELSTPGADSPEVHISLPVLLVFL